MHLKMSIHLDIHDDKSKFNQMPIFPFLVFFLQNIVVLYNQQHLASSTSLQNPGMIDHKKVLAAQLSSQGIYHLADGKRQYGRYCNTGQRRGTMKEKQVSVSIQKKDTWVEIGVSCFQPTYITGIILTQCFTH